jgi:hypothetical protein
MIELIEHKYIKLYPEFEEPLLSYNVISCTVFRMITSYKEEFKYGDGLRILFENFQYHFPKFYLRIYYDNSVLSKLNSNSAITESYERLFKELRLSKHVQLIRYEMESFKIDETYHMGVIGTFARFIPFFDLKENKNIDTVIVAEIDVQVNVLRMMQKNLQKMIHANCDVFYATRNCYDLHERFIIVKDEFDTKFPILAGTIITKIKFPISILNDFFYCSLNQNTIGCSYMLKFSKSIGEYIQKINSKTNINFNTIPYGFDELFTLLIKKYLRDNKINHLIRIDNNVAQPYYNLLLNYKDNLITEEQFKFTLEFILNTLYDKSKSLIENYNMLDNITYKYQKYGKIDIKYIIERTQLLLSQEDKLSKIGFLKDDITCINTTIIQPAGYKYFTIEYS